VYGFFDYLRDRQVIAWACDPMGTVLLFLFALWTPWDRVFGQVSVV